MQSSMIRDPSNSQDVSPAEANEAKPTLSHHALGSPDPALSSRVRESLLKTFDFSQGSELAESAESGPQSLASVLFFGKNEEVDFSDPFLNELSLCVSHEGGSIQRDHGGNLSCIFPGENSEISAARVYHRLKQSFPDIIDGVSAGIYTDNLSIRDHEDQRLYRTFSRPFPSGALSDGRLVFTESAYLNADHPRARTVFDIQFESFDVEGRTYQRAIDMHRTSHFRVGGPSRVYGRNDELASFKKAFCGNREMNYFGGVVTIGGPPGVGKSRLMDEFVSTLQEYYGEKSLGTMVAKAWSHDRTVPASFLREAFLPELLRMFSELPVDIRPEMPTDLWGQIALFRKSPREFFDKGYSLLKIFLKLLSLIAGSDQQGAQGNRYIAVLLDDCQWIDDVSLEVINELTQALLPRVLIGLPARDDQEKAPKSLQRAVQVAEKNGKSLLKLTLPELPLFRDGSATGVFDAFVSDPNELDIPSGKSPFSVSEALDIQRVTHGNPLYLDSLLQLLLKRGNVQKGMTSDVSRALLQFDARLSSREAILQSHLEQRSTPSERQVYQWITALNPCRPEVFERLLPEDLRVAFFDLANRKLIDLHPVVHIYHAELSGAVKKLYPAELRLIAREVLVKVSPDFADSEGDKISRRNQLLDTLSPSYLYQLAVLAKNVSAQARFIRPALRETLSSYRLSDAERIILKALHQPRLRASFDPGDLELELGTLLLRRGKYDKSGRFYQRAYAAFSSSPPRNLEVRRMNRERLYLMASNPPGLAAFHNALDKDRVYMDGISGEDFSDVLIGEKWSLQFDEARFAYRSKNYPAARSLFLAFIQSATEAVSSLTAQNPQHESLPTIQRLIIESSRLLANMTYHGWQNSFPDNDSLQRSFPEIPSFQHFANDAYRDYSEYIRGVRRNPHLEFEPTSQIMAFAYAGASAGLAANSSGLSSEELGSACADAETNFSEAVRLADDLGVPHYQAQVRHEEAKWNHYFYKRNPAHSDAPWRLGHAILRYKEACQEVLLIHSFELASYSSFGLSVALFDRASLRKKSPDSDENIYESAPSSFQTLLQSFDCYKKFREIQKPSELPHDDFLHFEFLPHLASVLKFDDSLQLPNFIDATFVGQALDHFDSHIETISAHRHLDPYKTKLQSKRLLVSSLLQRLRAPAVAAAGGPRGQKRRVS